MDYLANRREPDYTSRDVADFRIQIGDAILVFKPINIIEISKITYSGFKDS
jgi:hypothetical protein